MALVQAVEDGKIVSNTSSSEDTKASNNDLGYDQFLQLLCAEMQYQGSAGQLASFFDHGKHLFQRAVAIPPFFVTMARYQTQYMTTRIILQRGFIGYSKGIHYNMYFILHIGPPVG